MIASKQKFVRLSTAKLIVSAVMSAGCLFMSSPRLEAQEAAKPEAKGAKLKVLLKERLAIAREMVRLSTGAYKTGAGSFVAVHEVTRLVLDAELQQCDSDKDRQTVLENYIAESSAIEELTAKLVETGQLPAITMLKAKAERLQAEIALERAKTTAMSSLGSPNQVTMAEKRLGTKRAAVKVAEAQKSVMMAKLASTKAKLAEAQAAESFAEKQLKHFEEMVKHSAISANLVDERRTQLAAAKAQWTAAEAMVLECEAQVQVEQARVEVAQCEAEEAELRLKQLKVGVEKSHRLADTFPD